MDNVDNSCETENPARLSTDYVNGPGLKAVDSCPFMNIHPAMDPGRFERDLNGCGETGETVHNAHKKPGCPQKKAPIPVNNSVDTVENPVGIRPKASVLSVFRDFSGKIR